MNRASAAYFVSQTLEKFTSKSSTQNASVKTLFPQGTTFACVASGIETAVSTGCAYTQEAHCTKSQLIKEKSLSLRFGQWLIKRFSVWPNQPECTESHVISEAEPG